MTFGTQSRIFSWLQTKMFLAAVRFQTSINIRNVRSLGVYALPRALCRHVLELRREVDMRCILHGDAAIPRPAPGLSATRRFRCENCGNDGGHHPITLWTASQWIPGIGRYLATSLWHGDSKGKLMELNGGMDPAHHVTNDRSIHEHPIIIPLISISQK